MAREKASNSKRANHEEWGGSRYASLSWMNSAYTLHCADDLGTVNLINLGIRRNDEGCNGTQKLDFYEAIKFNVCAF